MTITTRNRFGMLAQAGLVLLAATTVLGAALRPQAETLRVCADPDNLPFSNRQGEGFENRIADLIAQEWGGSATYAWWRQMRGFVRNTLRAGACDVIIGIPKGYDPVLSTEPYYRSSYVFVYRADRDIEVTSLDDPILSQLRIGVNLLGDDYTNPPPAHALGARGITGNVQGYHSFYSETDRPSAIIEALASGEIDVAIVWGPLGGYWAKQQQVRMTIVPLPERDSVTGFPMAYDISMGVRRGDDALKARLEEVVARKRSEIDRILEDFGVPLAGVARSRLEQTNRSPSGGTDARGDILQANVAAVDTPSVVSADVYAGWKWWHVYCFRCHGVDAIGATLGPDLRQSVTGSLTKELFLETGLNGRPEKGMPAWSTLLTEEQLAQVYRYVLERAEGRLAPGRPNTGG